MKCSRSKEIISLLAISRLKLLIHVIICSRGYAEIKDYVVVGVFSYRFYILSF